jgi:Rrf2 family protein
MIPLKSAELVRTVRGCNGGYSLNKSPEDITILNIIELFEGKIEFAECNAENKGKCSLLDRCFTSEVWAHLSKSLRDEAAKITLASILEKIDGQTQEYVI